MAALLLLWALLGVLLAAPPTAAAQPVPPCPNESLRTGPSAQLPDCRAYELVSPPDSNGRRLNAEGFTAFDVFPSEELSPLRDSFVFSASGSPLREPTGGMGLADLYEAERTAGGWRVVRHVTPSGDESVLPETGGLSSDHDYIFVHAGPVTNEVGVDLGSLFQGSDATYLGDSEGNFELVGIGEVGGGPVIEKLAQGRYISPGGEHVIFSTGEQSSGSHWCAIALTKSRPCPVNKLADNAPPTGTIYDRGADGPTQVVSLLPGDVTPAAGENATYQGASADGSVVAFKVKGTLYARVDNEETLKVAEGDPTFGGLSQDGRLLFYVAAGDIHRLDTATEADTEVNSSGDGKMVNVSADGTHVYFVSEQQLDGSEGTAGQPNLYVWSGGSPNFVATVESGDLPVIGNWTSAVSPESGKGPGMNGTRTTPDGSTIVFASKAQLTPFDNAGETEIYRWSEEGEEILCASCNPGGGPASFDARLEDLQVPTVLHNLSEDGSRVFFETEEALVEEDVDGVNDVYEWHEEEGSASVALISSGESPKLHEIPGTKPNLLMGVKPDGSEVFFRSLDALAPGAGEGGVPAIYDARIGGGFAQPSTPPPCLEEECRPPLSPPPPLGAASSSALRGAGNVAAERKKHRKRRRRGRCARKRHCARKRARGRAAVSTAGGEGGEVAPSAPAGSASKPSVGGSAGVHPIAALSGEFESYGIESVHAEVTSAAAAQHPDFAAGFDLKPLGSLYSPKTENIVASLPPGLIGNPSLTPKCTTGKFLASECPTDSQVGIGRVKLATRPPGVIPLYNLAPPHPDDEIARLGLVLAGIPTYIDVSLRTASDYGITATVYDAPAEVIEEAETIIWGNPADESHDEQRLTAEEAPECPGTACKAPGGKRSSGLEPFAFLTNPSACGEGEVGFSLTSYQIPGQIFSASAPLEPGPIDECEGLPFEPSFEAHSTSHVAGAPTGLETVLTLPQSSDPDLPGTATMREAEVALPEGMGISSSAADGLAACSEEEVGFHEEVNAQCPDASKLGTATIVSPALSEPIEGALYQRTPRPGHLFGLWLVSDDFGLHVKIPGEVQADPDTGQLTATFKDLPQVPVEEIDLDVWGGPRAPLKNPDSCGTYQSAFSFTPHSDDPPVSGESEMAIDEGCGPRPFNPKLDGGATEPVAGAFSPFVFDLAREDGEQELASFEVTPPEGLLAKLAGVPLCGEAEAGSGSCPAGSKVGSLIASAGAGPNPLWIPQPGKDPTAIYLAGPYKGAPYSLVSVVPAQAGPFDLGDVVVRSALSLDPETALVTVKTDPLPQLVEGVPVIYRRLHAVVDRPEFTLNPTDCSELALSANVSSTEGAVAHPSQRFQVDGCAALPFAPRLSLRLLGATRRGGFPRLLSRLQMNGIGEAGIASAKLLLPHSEFIANAHFRNICTRVQFREGAGNGSSCPPGSVYGYARASTPLLDQPLEGPVLLRSNPERKLPDVVAALHGSGLAIDLVGNVDSVKGRLRTTFAATPDAPVSSFEFELQGGKKGLFENSADLCLAPHRASLSFAGQNGKAQSSHPLLQVKCKRKPRRGRR